MAEHHIVDWIGTILLILFGLTMIVQGYFIYHGKWGYKHSEREDKKMEQTRKLVEKLIKDK